MATNVNDIIKRLSPAQRKKVEVRTAELIAEEMTLRELRKARRLTQVRMAKSLGILRTASLAWKNGVTSGSTCGSDRSMGGNRLYRRVPDRALGGCPVAPKTIRGGDPQPKYPHWFRTARPWADSPTSCRIPDSGEVS